MASRMKCLEVIACSLTNVNVLSERRSELGCVLCAVKSSCACPLKKVGFLPGNCRRESDTSKERDFLGIDQTSPLGFSATSWEQGDLIQFPFFNSLCKLCRQREDSSGKLKSFQSSVVL